jgi:hypothetical protein
MPASPELSSTSAISSRPEASRETVALDTAITGNLDGETVPVPLTCSPNLGGGLTTAVPSICTGPALDFSSLCGLLRSLGCSGE